jgi:class 3 adenylate cyclase
MIEPQIAKHAGRLFKAMGDGFLVEFASAVQAVSCAKDWVDFALLLRAPRSEVRMLSRTRWAREYSRCSQVFAFPT